MADLGPQLFHIIAVALLTEFTKATEILTDLRGRDIHLKAQGVGGNADHALGTQIIQMTVIPRQTPDDSIGNVLLFHKK